MLLLTHLSQVLNQLALTAVLPQFWALPFLLFLRLVDPSSVSKWTTWLVMTLFLGSPYAHPIQVGWVSRNANAVRSRAVGAAMYNMCVQGYVLPRPVRSFSSPLLTCPKEAASSHLISTARTMRRRTSAGTPSC